MQLRRETLSEFVIVIFATGIFSISLVILSGTATTFSLTFPVFRISHKMSVATRSTGPMQEKNRKYRIYRSNASFCAQQLQPLAVWHRSFAMSDRYYYLHKVPCMDC